MSTLPPPFQPCIGLDNEKQHIEEEVITWSLQNRLIYLNYADDTCLLVHTDTQKLLDRLITRMGLVGLRINVAKTKLMRINTKNTNQININVVNKDRVERRLGRRRRG